MLTHSQTLARAFATNGRGQHGVDGKNGSDPLFSQGSVKANAAAGLLAAVNVCAKSPYAYASVDKLLTPVAWFKLGLIVQDRLDYAINADRLWSSYVHWR